MLPSALAEGIANICSTGRCWEVMTARSGSWGCLLAPWPKWARHDHLLGGTVNIIKILYVCPEKIKEKTSQYLSNLWPNLKVRSLQLKYIHSYMRFCCPSNRHHLLPMIAWTRNNYTTTTGDPTMGKRLLFGQDDLQIWRTREFIETKTLTCVRNTGNIIRQTLNINLDKQQVLYLQTLSKSIPLLDRPKRPPPVDATLGVLTILGLCSIFKPKIGSTHPQWITVQLRVLP